MVIGINNEIGKQGSNLLSLGINTLVEGIYLFYFLHGYLYNSWIN